MTINIKTTTLHELLWQGKQNRQSIVRAICDNCITKGKSTYWFWADFTGAWYRNAQNAFNQMGSCGVIASPFTSSNVLSRAINDYPNFEMPCRDLNNDNGPVYYITINDFGDGLEKMAMLHPSLYKLLMNCIFNEFENSAIQTMQPENYQDSWDFAFQYIVMGRQKYIRNNQR
jgi:hypothetical protein